MNIQKPHIDRVHIRISRFVMLAALAITAAACSEDYEYIPGEPDSPDCQGVYFADDNETDFLFIPGLPSVATLNVHRLNTAADADVPLIIESDIEGVDFPTTVHFDAGSADSEISIDFAGMTGGKTCTFKIIIPDDYISHYAANMFDYTSTVLLSQWQSANKDGSPVKFYFTNSDYTGTESEDITQSAYLPVESEMEVLPGASMIRIKNFINTGLDMIFTITESPYPDYEGYYRITPLENKKTFVEAFSDESYGDDYYNAWYLYDQSNKSYASASLTTLAGKSSTLKYIYFYAWSDTDAADYTYMSVKSDYCKYNSVSMGIGGTASGVSIPTYFYLYFRWDGESGI